LRRLFKTSVEITKETLHQINRAQLMMAASSLAYTTILSIIPLLAVSFAVFQIFGGMEKFYSLVEPFILSNLAEGVNGQVTKLLEGFISNVHPTRLGIVGVTGLIFTGVSMLSSIEGAINRVWEVPLKRTWPHRLFAYCFFVVIGPIALAIILGFATSEDYPISKLIPSSVATFFIIASLLSIAYQLIPDTRVSPKYSLLGGFSTALVLTVAHLVYHLYISKMISYHKIYGSLGAVPVLLLWVYILWLIVLIGSAFTASLQRVAAKSQWRKSS
jgi:membrane protein